MAAPSVQSIVRSGLRYYYGEIQIRDFSGGWNIRDAASELAQNESPDLYNVTLDERGGIGKRLGFVKYNTNAFNASLTSNGVYWSTGQNQITQSGTELFKDTAASSFKTFTTTERCAFADFTGLLWFIHPTDGLFKYDGTTVTAVGAGPKGTCLATWQNKLWAAGDPLNKPRVYFSAAGDGTSWPGTNFVDLREKDTEVVANLSGAAGVDISGRPGLLAFKRRSTYRIFDSSTGAFQTLDTQIGAASATAVTNGFQRTVALGETGIWWTDGVGPMRPASDKISPLFDPNNINFAKLDLVCAGFKGDRMYFSLPRAGSTANDLELEYHPLQGWIVPNSCAASFYSTYGKDTQKLYAGSPSVNGRVYERFSSGADDGTAITSRYKTHWIEPTGGHHVRIGRVALVGRGAFTVNLYKDYALGQFETFAVNLIGSQAIYDDAGAVYDQAGVLYGPLNYQDEADFPINDVVDRAILLEVTETSSGTSSGVPILGSGSSPTIGAWGLYDVSVIYRPLGIG